MIGSAIYSRIRDMIEGIRDQEQALCERLFEVQTPAEFRAVMQMRVALEKTRRETRQEALALACGGSVPECPLATTKEPPAAPKQDLRRVVLARHGHCSDLNFGLATATIERLPSGVYRFGYDLWWNEGAFGADLGFVTYPSASRAAQAAIRALLERFPQPRGYSRKQLRHMRAQMKAKLIALGAH